MTEPTMRDGLSFSIVTDDDYRRWYHEDRFRIGSTWVTTQGGSMFMPNIGIKDAWELVERDGDCLVLLNPDKRARKDEQYRLCYDAGYDGFMVLAFSLRPEYAYRVDGDTGDFVADPEGTFFIEGSFPNYHVRGAALQVYIGPALRFYRDPQEDIFKLAKVGKLGNILRRVHEKEEVKKHVRRCDNCGKALPATMKLKDKYCSVACGKNASSPVMTVNNYECVECGKGFRRTGPGNHRFCSDSCKHSKKKNASVTIRKDYKCIECGTMFQRPGSGNHRFCTPECGHFNRMRARLERNEIIKVDRVSTCQHCGMIFKYRSPGPARRYCSNFCKTMG